MTYPLERLEAVKSLPSCGYLALAAGRQILGKIIVWWGEDLRIVWTILPYAAIARAEGALADYLPLATQNTVSNAQLQIWLIDCDPREYQQPSRENGTFKQLEFELEAKSIQIMLCAACKTVLQILEYRMTEAIDREKDRAARFYERTVNCIYDLLIIIRHCL